MFQLSLLGTLFKEHVEFQKQEISQGLDKILQADFKRCHINPEQKPELENKVNLVKQTAPCFLQDLDDFFTTSQDLIQTKTELGGFSSFFGIQRLQNFKLELFDFFLNFVQLDHQYGLRCLGETDTPKCKKRKEKHLVFPSETPSPDPEIASVLEKTARVFVNLIPL